MIAAMKSRIRRFVADSLAWRLLRYERIAAYLLFWARAVVALRRPFIIGVTGSVGKTTTTTMIAAVLSHPEARPIVGEIGTSLRNMNDDVGLPLTILRYEDWLRGESISRLKELLAMPVRALRLATSGHYPKILVLEFGAHWKGHLGRLTKVARPNLAIVTTIGPAHLERLRTLQGVAQEKSALVRAVRPSGLVMLGDDHELVSYLEQASQAPVVKVSGYGIELARNIARAVGRHFQIPDHVIEDALSRVELPKGRLNRLELTGFTVIDDSHNANPLSMKLGLDALAESSCSRKVAVLGHMAEMGDEVRRYHNEIGAYARARADIVVAVGELSKAYDADIWFETSDACAAEIERLIQPGDCILVKGSASAKMKHVVARLQEISEKQSAAPADH